ncbi:unnamed protein product [Owenia fusiformis]|uniref:Uncharacterized protein n=1 Tax=Owenia fusiformis TaxID=6347 RepID=A0A8J1T9S2_OWEFU|nr:unnamed protein product [Owenia fusiformis]
MQRGIIGHYYFSKMEFTKRCWFCKSTNHTKRQCELFKNARYFCSKCQIYGHRNKDHQDIPTLQENFMKAFKSASTQTKHLKSNERSKQHNKYCQTATVNMDIYKHNMDNYKRIESELYGQKNGNRIYKERIQTLQSQNVNISAVIKAQDIQIQELQKDLLEYSDRTTRDDKTISKLKSDLTDSEVRICSLTASCDKHLSTIIDITNQLKEQSETIEIYKTVIKTQQEKLDQIITRTGASETTTIWKQLGEHLFWKGKTPNQQAILFDV